MCNAKVQDRRTASPRCRLRIQKNRISTSPTTLASHAAPSAPSPASLSSRCRPPTPTPASHRDFHGEVAGWGAKVKSGHCVRVHVETMR
eukprot:2774412-Prymnesium_polylepis.1